MLGREIRAQYGLVFSDLHDFFMIPNAFSWVP